VRNVPPVQALFLFPFFSFSAPPSSPSMLPDSLLSKETLFGDIDFKLSPPFASPVLTHFTPHPSHSRCEGLFPPHKFFSQKKTGWTKVPDCIIGHVVPLPSRPSANESEERNRAGSL